MRILHLTWSFKVGGIETMLVDIANEQAKGNNVAIFCINDNVEKSLITKLHSSILFYSLGRKLNSHSILPWIKLNYAVWKFHPNVMHFHMGGISKLIIFKTPRIRTVHNTHAFLSDLKHYDKLCAISESVKKYIETACYSNVSVIYNGIYPEKLKTKNSEFRLPLNIVCVGRLHQDKGQTVLLQAIKLLVDKYKQTAFHLDLIGDGPLYDEIVKYIDQNRLSEYVNLNGARDRTYVYNHLCDYDLYVLPSVSEGFGLTLAEAVCSKIAVITSELEGPMEVINNGKYGYTFKTGNVQDLADKLNLIIKEGIDEEKIENAYKFAIHNFDVKDTARNYLDVYFNTRELWKGKKR